MRICLSLNILDNHTLINGGLFSSPTNVGHHNPSPSGTLFPSSNRCGTAPKSTLLRGPASLLAPRLVSTALRGTTRRLAHRPVSGSDIICNGPDPVDSGNSEDSVDEKLVKGFFEGKISGSKWRESERFAESAEDSISYFHLVERFK